MVMDEKQRIKQLEERVALLEKAQTDLELTRNELREERRRWTTLTRNLTGMVYRCKCDMDWTMEYVSDNALGLTGYSPDDLMAGRKVVYGTLIYADDRHIVREALQKAVEDKSMFQVLYRIITKTGEQKWVYEKGGPIFSDDGLLEAMEGYIVNVTMLVQTDKRLKLQNAVLEAQLEASPDGILVVGNAGNWLSHNHRFIEMWQIPEQIAISADDQRALEWCKEQVEDPDNWISRINTLYEHPHEISHDEIVFKDGRTFERHSSPIIDRQDSIHGRVWFFRDITTRKNAETLLTDEVNMRQMLVEQSKDGIIILDENGAIFEANQQFAIMLGYTVAEIRDMHVWDWDTNYSKNELLEMFKNSDEQGSHFVTSQKRKDGSFIDVEISTNSNTYRGRKLIFCVQRDITQRLKAQKEREKLIRELTDALTEIKTLRGILPLCSYCKKIRNDKGFWEQVDVYIHKHSRADISHSICPDCMEKYYPDISVVEES